MRCGASVLAGLAAFVAGPACDRGSANRILDAPPVVRVAVGTDVGRAALEGGGRGEVNHLLPLVATPAFDRLEVVERRGPEVVLRLRRPGDRADEIAETLRHPDLIAARATSDTLVVATFEDSQSAASFDLQFAGVAGGSHTLAESGLILEPQPGRAVSKLELVPAPRERHWRLLNGGHVDVAPVLRQHEAERLRRLSSIRTVELPATGFVSLILSERLSASSSTLAELFDVDTLARSVCGQGCRARLPGQVANPSGQRAVPSSVELLYLDDADAEATGARLLAHQLREHDVEARLEPVDVGELTRRFSTGDFDLLLTVAPISAESFPTFLEMVNIPKDQAAERLIPLWYHRLYAAYDTSICGLEPDSTTSWGWLAAARPCEGAR